MRQENLEIIRTDAIYGVPDLVIEIISEHDRPSGLIPLEADYRLVGVPEIIFIDPRRQRVWHLRKTDYEEAFLTTDELIIAAIPGFRIPVQWLFDEEKPDASPSPKTSLKPPKPGGSRIICLFCGNK